MQLFLFFIIFLSLDPAAFVDGGDESRVYGGHRIDITDAPWMAYIEYNLKGGRYSYCGGTIVNEMFILTAAHCAYNEVGGVLRRKNASQYEIRIGSSNRDEGGSVYKVAEVIPHPSYEPVDMPHDVALLRLTKKITYNRRPVQNVRLDSSNREYSAGEKVSSMGWGKNPEHPGTPNIYKVDLHIVNTAQCAMAYGDSQSEYKKHKICALGPRPKNGDVCEGDSGGPLLSNEKEQIGVVSYGGDCPQTDGKRSPGVYAKIADNLAWIKRVTSGSKEKVDEKDNKQGCGSI